MVKQAASKALFWCAIAAQGGRCADNHLRWAPLYQRLVTGATNVGSAKDYALGFMAIVVMEVSYWAAYRLQPHLRFRWNVLVGHLLCCIGEVSFLFIAVLGTVVLLDRWHDLQFALWKVPCSPG